MTGGHSESSGASFQYQAGGPFTRNAEMKLNGQRFALGPALEFVHGPWESMRKSRWSCGFQRIGLRWPRGLRRFTRSTPAEGMGWPTHRSGGGVAALPVAF